MKLTSIEIHPEGSSNIGVLSFRDPRRLNSLNVKSIVGLDADDIRARQEVGPDGDTNTYHSLTLQRRLIVMRIGLNPRPDLDESYASLRDKIYKMIFSSRSGQVQLLFKNGTEVVATITGLVTKVETDHFEKDQEVQVTIKCNGAMLKAPERIELVGLDPDLILVDDDLSNAPHGFRLEVAISGTVDQFMIWPTGSSPPEWYFEVIPWFVDPFVDGDILHFSSEYDDKYIYILRDDEPIHLAQFVSSTSYWPILFPGENQFVLPQSPELLTITSLSYYPTYWGV